MEINTENETEAPRGFGGKPDPEPQTDADGNEMASEEEELDYDLLTVRARKMIFGPGKDKILKMLGTSESPAQGMGKVGSMLIKSLVQSAKQSGREISPDAAINAGTEIVDDLNELAKANNVFQYDSPKDEEQEVADALMWGVKFYGDGMVSSGELTPEMQQMAGKQVQEGLAEEGVAQPTQIAQGVNQAMSPQQPQQPGLVAGNMGGAV